MRRSTGGSTIGVDSLPARGHPPIRFQDSIGTLSSGDAYSSGIAVKGSRRLTFDIPKIRSRLTDEYGRTFDVFVAKAGLVPLTKGLCSGLLAHPRVRSQASFAKFRLKVDDVLFSRLNVGYRDLTTTSLPGQQVIVPVPPTARRLTLSVQYSSAVARKCTRAVWAGAQLQSAQELPFRTCQHSCKEDAMNNVFYLSCFLGVCTGETTFTSSPPFFWVRQATWGIGMDTAGAFSSKQPIWLPNSNHPSRHGIGAHTTSGIIFDLDAIRLANASFTTFSFLPGIDRNSACWNGVIGLEFRVYLDGRLAFTKQLAHHRDTNSEVHVPVHGAHRLELVTRNMFQPRRSCPHAVWANARLWSFLRV